MATRRSRSKSPFPRLLRHSGVNQGYINFQGRRLYLGVWPKGEPNPPRALDAEYRAVIAKIALGQDVFTPDPEEDQAPQNLTLAMLADRWLTWADNRYRDSPKTRDNLLLGVKALLDRFGKEPVEKIGPKRIAEVQALMAARGRTRQGINMATGYIRQMFRWGVSEELIDQGQYIAIKSLPPLKYGQIEARESKPMEAVSLEAVKATLPFLSRTVGAMVRLQALTGMRPAEVCGISMADIKKESGQLWVYTPSRHKTFHHGCHRAIPLIPESISVLLPFVRDEGDPRPLFSPAECRKEWEAEKRANRKTKVQPSQENRSKAAPLVSAGDAYTTTTYRRAIERGASRANIPLWSPNRLRKLAAQGASDAVGLDCARALLGHTDSATTKGHYIKNELGRAQVAAEANAKIIGHEILA